MRQTFRPRPEPAIVRRPRRPVDGFAERADRLRAVPSEVAQAENRERRRIAAGLHDQVGQVLGVAKMKLGQALAAGSAKDARAAVAEGRKLVEKAIREIRSLTFELSSPVLHDLGLEPALRDLAERAQERHGVAFDFEVEAPPGPLVEEVAVLLYSVVRELMWNAVKHAGARRGCLVLARDGDRLRITVADDGVGFDASGAGTTLAAGGGLGLFNARRRLEHFDGSLEIDSVLGAGTRIVLSLPVDATEPEG